MTLSHTAAGLATALRAALKVLVDSAGVGLLDGLDHRDVPQLDVLLGLVHAPPPSPPALGWWRS